MITEKRCTKCLQIKILSSFHKCKNYPDGYHYACKLCRCEYEAKKRKENPEQTRAKDKEKYIMNCEKNREVARKYRKEHPDKTAEATRIWREKYPEKIKKYARDGAKRRRLLNPEKSKEITKQASRKSRSTLAGKLRSNITRAINQSLRKGVIGKGHRHWEDLVGYTLDQLRVHLEKQFKEGMSWDNYGAVWEIDHKIPVSVFNFEKPEDIDFTRCWSLKNLQPLERFINRSKSNKLIKPFQPSLTI